VYIDDVLLIVIISFCTVNSNWKLHKVKARCG